MLPVRSVPISCPARSPLRSPVIRPHRIACISACLAVFLVCLFGILPAQAASIPLFGTVEFRRPLDSLPAWAEVRRMNELEPIFVSGKVFTRTATWDSFKQGAQGKSGMELLRYVNTFWNRFPYREDIINWGKADYWVWPNLFLKKSGDCEDYAIVKYFTLKELGMDTDKLRIVVLRDTLAPPVPCRSGRLHGQGHRHPGQHQQCHPAPGAPATLCPAVLVQREVTLGPHARQKNKRVALTLPTPTSLPSRIIS